MHAGIRKKHNNGELIITTFGFFENFKPVRPNVHGSTSGNNVVTDGFIQNL